MPDVTVIISSHNAAGFIGAAIASVLAQTHAPSEILVVDDSTDDSPRAIQGYVAASGGRLRLLRVEPCNISRARNIALNAARGSYIAFLDGDDVWMPDKLARQLDALHNDPQAIGVWCRYFDFEKDVDDLGRRQIKTTADNPTMVEVLLRSDIPASTQLFRARPGPRSTGNAQQPVPGAACPELVEGGVRFDERSGHGEDVIFAAALRLAGTWRLVDAPLVGKRLHAAQVTRSAWHRLWSAQTRVRWCHEHAALIGADTVRRVEEVLWTDLVRSLELLYWKRRVADLPQLRRAAEELCPQVLAASFLAKTRIYPRWVYRLRDALSPPRGK